MRWFRKALTFNREEDRFLGLFIALEAVSDDVRAAAEVTPKCQRCGADLNSFTSHLEGIKELLSLHPELPKDIFNRLRTTRGRIAHGDLSEALTNEVRQYLPLMERLTAEGIAISLGVDPTTVYVRTAPLYGGAVFGTVPFDPEKNPLVTWGGSVLEAVEPSRSVIGR
jgi:hypothetical protein